MKRFYVDTCIWVDLYEDRKGFNGEKLGKYAFDLLIKIKLDNSLIVISELTIKELGSIYSLKEVISLLKPFKSFLKHIVPTKQEKVEAVKIANTRNLPKGDVLHAILARNHNSTLVTRDNYFKELVDISDFFKPEDLV